MTEADWSTVAELIHASTNGWYEGQGRPPVFGCGPEDVQVFCRVYESLDPGCCVIAEEGNRILGSCFYHPRPTHVSLGIMNAHPDAFGQGIARQLLQFVVDFAAHRGQPVRLVSSAMNLDSFSLYNRAGFRPFGVYQDMVLEVPPEGFPHRPAGVDAVRDGRASDIDAMVDLEMELVGIDRRRDFEHFVADPEGIFHLSILRSCDGLAGFLASVAHPASTMLGPGVMRTPAAALALIATALDARRGHRPVFLPPADQPELTGTLYRWGARNCEIHFGQVLGPARRPGGIVMPTFLPESG
jgi:GNAT superfamily N-acetyltransferase